MKNIDFHYRYKTVKCTNYSFLKDFLRLAMNKMKYEENREIRSKSKIRH